MTSFFNISVKKESHSNTRKVLLRLFKTRWSERDVAYEPFCLAMPFMYEAFSLIAGTHPQYAQFKDQYVEGWSRDDKTKAAEFMSCISRFEFIIRAVSLYSRLDPLHGLTQKLQGRSKDIVAAYQGVEEIIRQLKSMRENMEDTYRCINNYACIIAEKTGCKTHQAPHAWRPFRTQSQCSNCYCWGALQEQSWHPAPRWHYCEYEPAI